MTGKPYVKGFQTMEDAEGPLASQPVSYPWLGKTGLLVWLIALTIACASVTSGASVGGNRRRDYVVWRGLFRFWHQ